MLIRKIFMLAIILIILVGTGIILAQDSSPLPDTPECDPSFLAEQQSTFDELLVIDFETDPESARDNLFRLGAAYQMLALQCGYEPSEIETDTMIQQVLSVATLSDLIAANSVGTDMDAILTELETVRGDLFNGELLYIGTENGLDGAPLGCVGCHSIESAPPLEGTWTRADEIRLQLDQFADYDVERYLVESIIHPNDYIVPDYMANLMPANYGSRLDIQMLADIVAYLDSQDQLLDE